MPLQRSLGVLVASKALAVSLVIVLFFFSHLGGLLNRSRGGYVNFRKSATNSSDDSLDLDYWPAEICKNLLFAVPTGLIVVSVYIHCSCTNIPCCIQWLLCLLKYACSTDFKVSYRGGLALELSPHPHFPPRKLEVLLLQTHA